MKWTEEAVLQAADTVGFGGTLWILYLAGNTDVGVGKTSDYHTQKSSVRSYAKGQGLSDPGVPPVQEGYENISRKPVVDAEGNKDTINDQHKPTIVSLTSLGKGLMKTVDNDGRIRASVKESTGIEIDEPQDPWWPGQGPYESASVFLHTYADRSAMDEEECEITAKARFDCQCCGEEIENEFQLTLNEGNIVEGWGRFIEMDCESCETTWKYSAANPYYDPETP